MDKIANHKAEEFQKYLEELTEIQKKIVAIEIYPCRDLQKKYDTLIAYRRALATEMFFLTNDNGFSVN